MEHNYDIFFYDVKTGETLFDYTLEDFIRDNYDETEDYDNIYDNVLINDLKDYVNKSDLPKIKEYEEKLIIHSEDSDTTKEQIIPENDGNNSSEITAEYMSNKINTEIIDSFAESDLACSSYDQFTQGSCKTEIISENTVVDDCIYVNMQDLPKVVTEPQRDMIQFKLKSINEQSLLPQNNTPTFSRYKKYENKIIYSNNIFLHFKNYSNYILNVIPLSDKEIEILKQIFLFKNRNIINPVKIYYEDGSIYRGEITKKYERNGFGTIKYINGDIFSVLWAKNFSHGFGIYHCFDNTQLIGNWKNNTFHGKNNVINYCNGSIYEGNIEYNIISGYGIMKYYDGSIYEGYWYNNMYFLNGIITYPNGTTYQYVNVKYIINQNKNQNQYYYIQY